MLVIAAAVVLLNGGREEERENQIVSTEYGRGETSQVREEEPAAADQEESAEPEQATPTPAPSEITATLVENANSVQMDGLDKVKVLSATATSTISQNNGVTNEPLKMFDDSLQTNWEEGVSGPGIGEYVDAQFDQEYRVKYLFFWLGNWKNDKYYKGNNRPKTLTLKMGEFETQIVFPDSKEKFCVELSYPCKASQLRVVLDDVYQGSSWDDTCISDIHIYGEK